MDLKSLVRTIPDFPHVGIMFRDITTLIADGPGFAAAVDALAAPYKADGIDLVAGIEARGFIVGGAVARALGVGFVPVRKAGKLPHKTVGVDYVLEYGSGRIEMHADAVPTGARVLLIDDLIATGGTAAAALDLIRGTGATVAAIAAVIDLPELGGSAKLKVMGVPVHTLMEFGGH